ncbi:MAG: hypothetical protein ABSE62_13250 [Chthoniobacteraceae bacterium]|jgi:rubredoxin
MAQIICPKCQHVFDSNNPESFVTRAAVAIALGGIGFWQGMGIGVVFGGPGGISGAIPGLVIGAGAGWFAADQFRRCPKCGHIFKT